MFADLLPLYPWIVPFLLVLFRVVGLFVFVPVFSNAAIPGNVKVWLGVAIAVCLWPIVPKGGVMPSGVVGLTVAIVGEMGVGLLMGIMVSLVFMGLELGAHLISQQMGLSLAAVYDPMFDEQSTVIEQLAFWLGMVVFFSLGGHRELINALVHSYQTVPIGQAMAPERMLEVTLGCVTSALHLAMRVGAPGLVAFFLATLASGFIGRSMPQVNMMSVGLGLNLLVGFVMIMVGLVGWAMVAQQGWRGLFVTWGRVFGG